MYVDAGPITYQLQVSRQLNQYTVEDSQYLAGLPTGQGTLTPSSSGTACSCGPRTRRIRPHDRGPVHDRRHHRGRYHPVPLNAELNGYAWTQQILDPSGVEPAPNTTASFGPTQGGLLLFKLPTSAYSNRPLTLHIFPPTGAPATISLDS